MKKLMTALLLVSAMTVGCGAKADSTAKTAAETTTADTSVAATEQDETTVTETEVTEGSGSTVAWINGTHIVLTEKNNLEWQYFGGVEEVAPYEDSFKSLLSDSWDITDQESLIETVDALAGDQMHNQALLEEITELGYDGDFTEIDAWLDEQEDFDAEDKDQIKLMYEAYEKYGNKAILAWDYSRATQLLSQGYVAGYITYEEALDRELEIGKQIQTDFDSWDDFYDSYFLGYAYWSGESRTDSSSEYTKRVKLYEDLKNDKSTPLNLDWTLGLVKEW